jgi:hypothetical protein
MLNILAKVIALFNSQPDITKMGFLSSFFVTTPDSFTDAEYCDLDEIYEGEEIAPSVTDLSTGAVSLVEEKFVNKQIPLPVYALRSPAQIAALMNRQPGESAYVTQKVNWLARLANIIVKKMGRMTGMLRRSMEYQAAQVLQTGDIILTDEKGNQTFKLGLQTKASHFPTVVTPWKDLDTEAIPGGNDPTPLDDIDALADTIREDGLVDVAIAIFGDQSWKDFIKNSWVRENLKKDVLNMGAMAPQVVNLGGKRMGYIDYGAYRYLLFTYNARYNPFGDKDSKMKYLDPNKVILLPDTSDLDFRRIFGGIPTVRTDTTFDQIFGTDKTQIGTEYDIRPRVFWSDDNETFIAEVKSRPLMLPVSVNRFGCLTTA